MEIELPDGTVLDAPDGADPKTIVANYMRKSGGTSTAMDTINGLPPLRAAAGVIRSIARPILGIKDLTEGLSDDDRALLDHLNSVKGGLATAGDIAGSALTLGPGAGLAGDLGSALPMATRALAVPAMDATANAGMSALAVPEQGQTRGGNAALGAAGSALGSAAGQLVKGPVSSAAYQSFLNMADKVTGGLDKLFPAGYRNVLGTIESVSHGSVLPALVANAPKVADYLARTKPVTNFMTGEAAAQKYLQRALPGTIDYLSQAGAAAADGANN